MLACDCPTGSPNAVNTVWPATLVQACAVHLLRNSFGYAARQDWEKIAKALRPVCTAPTEGAALERFVLFTDAWGGKCPALVRLWEAAWVVFVLFLQCDVEIRKAVRPGATSPPTRPPSHASTWPS
jgi:transposase-like protein